MLLGSTLTPSLALPPLSALAVHPEPDALLTEPGADTELFQRIAVAKQLRKVHARVRRLRDRRCEARDARGDLRPLPFPLSDPALWRHCWNSFERYATAVRAAVAVPAHTVAGVHAKLVLAVIAARRGGARVYMYEDREWLEAALADLARLAGQGDDGVTGHRAKPRAVPRA